MPKSNKQLLPANDQLEMVEEEKRLPYGLTEQEVSILRAHGARCEAKPVSPPITVEKKSDGALHISYDHEEPGKVGCHLVMAALSTTSPAFYAEIIDELAHVYVDASRPATFKKLGQAVEIAKAIAPRDEIETLLAVQMTTIHKSMIKWAMRAEMANVGIDQIQTSERAMNRLARTFTMQMDALKRYRSNGQKVTVEHVTVNEGGQAIVGNVIQGVG